MLEPLLFYYFYSFVQIKSYRKYIIIAKKRRKINKKNYKPALSSLYKPKICVAGRIGGINFVRYFGNLDVVIFL